MGCASISCEEKGASLDIDILKRMRESNKFSSYTVALLTNNLNLRWRLRQNGGLVHTKQQRETRETKRDRVREGRKERLKIPYLLPLRCFYVKIETNKQINFNGGFNREQRTATAINLSTLISSKYVYMSSNYSAYRTAAE